MATFTWAAFLDELKDELEAHADLVGVRVTSFPSNPANDGNEGISFERITGGHDWHTMGPNFRDGYEIDGRLWARVGDTTVEAGKPSRDRAEEMLEAVVSILADVDAAVYTTSGAWAARLSRFEVTPRKMEDNAWRIEVELTVAVLAPVG